MKNAASAECCRSVKRRILIIDDHPITRQGLAGVINQQDDFIVCCDASNAAEGMRKLESGPMPDLVITDISLDGKSGLEFVRDLRAVHAEVRVLVLSMHDETIFAERALRAGANGYVMKRAGAEAILGAIRRILSGKISVSDEMSMLIIEQMSGRSPARAHSEINALTDREFEVFKLIGEGCSTRDVAQRLHLSPKTVDVYRQHIKEKFNLPDSVSLIQHAVRWVETSGRQGLV